MSQLNLFKTEQNTTESTHKPTESNLAIFNLALQLELEDTKKRIEDYQKQSCNIALERAKDLIEYIDKLKKGLVLSPNYQIKQAEAIIKNEKSKRF